VVAALGPGDSIGAGLAALLSGADRYLAFDRVAYGDLTRNLAIFDELVALFHDRAPIPDESEFPTLYPTLQSYDFPHDVLGEEGLREALAPRRVAAIRAWIATGSGDHAMIAYHAPWTGAERIARSSVEFLFSQAVLEHVDDLDGAYPAMRRWLRPGALMSHQIDFRCHGKAAVWNGHWGYSDRLWKIIVGRRPYLLNREPHSAHLRYIARNGFSILEDRVVRSPSGLRRSQLTGRFRGLDDDDLTTSGALVVAAATGP
jgi:hypothetical protein